MPINQKGSSLILILVLLVVLVIGLMASKEIWQKIFFPEVATNTTSQQAPTSLLFVNQSRTGSLTPINGKIDMWTLRLIDVDSQVLWFSDEPNRSTGWMSIETYVNSWKSFGFTSQNPPNAAIVVDPTTHGLKDGGLVVLLTDPIYEPKDKTLRFTATLLKSDPTEGLSRYKNSPNKTLPVNLQNPKVFIDNGIGTGAGLGSAGWSDGVDGN